MLQKLSNNNKHHAAILVAGLVLWVVVGFYLAQILILPVVMIFRDAISDYNPTVVNAVFMMVSNFITALVVIGLPYWVAKHKVTKKELGVERLPTWTDIILAPAGFIVYFVISMLLMFLAIQFLPWFDVEQSQDLGFTSLNTRLEYIYVFMALVVIGPIIEELVFRGYLYGRLRKYLPIWGAVLITSLVFGYMHGAWNVGVDVFGLSVVLCLMREYTGSIWTAVLIHMLKNGLVFFVLFIN